MCIVIVLLIKLLFVGQFSCNCPRVVLKLAKKKALTETHSVCNEMSQNFNCPLRYVILLFQRRQHLLAKSVHAEQRLANFGGI